MFPRRIRRGLIEASLVAVLTEQAARRFRGEFAAASLKHHADRLTNIKMCRFRGEFAAASLKRGGQVRHRGTKSGFRGEFAAASLKRITSGVLDTVVLVSAANSPRPH